MAHPSEAAALSQITFSLIVALLVLTWITVLLRLWVRYRITKNPGWDDATMVLSLMLFTSYCAFVLVITSRGSVAHLPTPEDLFQTLIYIQLSEVFYILTTTILKIALGLFFLRILTKPWQIRLFYGILGVSAIYGLFYVFIAIFQCGNPKNLADSFLGSRHCLPTWLLLTAGYIYGAINVIADWTFVLIPIVILVDSDMDKRSKISVSIVMGFGAIGSVSSILRMVYLKGLLFGGNITTDAVKATIWATAEPGTGIVAASIAILRPLFRQISNDIRGKWSEYGSGNRSQLEPTLRDDNRARDNDSMIALASVVTAGNHNESRARSNKESVYLARPSEDVWDASIERAQLGKVVNIHMVMENVPPTPPPKN